MLDMMLIKAILFLKLSFWQCCKNQKGVTAIEYGLIGLCIAAFIVYAFYNDAAFIEHMVVKLRGLGVQMGEMTPDRWGSPKG